MVGRRNPDGPTVRRLRAVEGLIVPLILLAGLTGVGGCESSATEPDSRRESKEIGPMHPHSPSQSAGAGEAAADTPEYERRRHRLVASWGGEIRDPRVLEAMRTVKRHAFVPPAIRRSAYADEALPIGESQTISQPWVVARMTELLMISPGDKVLEVGTGSGYQAAVLSRMGAEVYTIEIIEALADRARATLDSLGYQNIHFRIGDGYAGWPEAAPFDAVIITAAVDHVPGPLQEQLKVGGRLLLPLGSPNYVQYLTRFTRTDAGWNKERFRAVRFVPMTGKAEE